MKKRSFGNICIILGVFLILGAGGLYIHNILEERRAEQSADHITLELVEDLKVMAPETRPAGDAAQQDPNDQMNDAPDTEMDTVEIDGHTYIGLLTIPALDLKLPVMSEWSYPDLRISPCRYTGTVGDNDLVILAHNYKRHFGMLKTLGVGEEVAFTDVHSVTTVYKVMEIEEIEPTNVESMTISDFDLTLFTCTYGGNARFTVRCSRKEL